MNRERVQDLWTRHLSGERLEPAEKDELLEALKADAALRDELLRDSETDGMLRSARAGGDPFVEAFVDRVAAEKDSTRFIKTVTNRIRPRPAASTNWWPAVVAAGALVAILIFATQPKSVRVREEVVRFEREERDREIAAEVKELEAQQARAKARLEEIEKPRATAEREALARLEEERRQMLARFEAAKAAAKKLDEERTAPAPVDAPPRVPTTKVEPFATVVVEGETSSSYELKAGEGFYLASGRAVVTLSDRTRLVVEGGTKIREISERPPGAVGSRGKYVLIDEGVVTAKVTEQPVGRTMVFATAHARARVVGTELRLLVGKDSTRVDVRDGKVQLTRPAGGAALDLVAGKSALAAAGRPLVARDLLMVKSFTLVDQPTGVAIPGFDPIPEGAVIPIGGRPLDVRANVLGTAANVRFSLDGKDHRTEKTAPWTIAGNDKIKLAWRPVAGRVEVTAVPYAADLEAGWGLTLRFQLVR